MPRLDQRLQAVARLIRSDIHVDVGSDHGHLLLALLKSGRIRRGIAIENKRQPWTNSRATLAEVDADVRFGDGLEPLRTGETNSLSICGMGGQSIVSILSRFPDRVPDRLVFQPNQDCRLVRRWAFEHRYHLSDEARVGKRAFDILAFDRSNGDLDPAYEGLDREAAFLFGPCNIRRSAPDFVERLRTERVYYLGLSGQTEEVQSRLDAIDWVLAFSGRR